MSSPDRLTWMVPTVATVPLQTLQPAPGWDSDTSSNPASTSEPPTPRSCAVTRMRNWLLYGTSPLRVIGVLVQAAMSLSVCRAGVQEAPPLPETSMRYGSSPGLFPEELL